MGVVDHLRDEHCDLCGKVDVLNAVYVPRVDESMALCEDCEPKEDR